MTDPTEDDAPLSADERRALRRLLKKQPSRDDAVETLHQIRDALKDIHAQLAIRRAS